jgi:hypothetical protein
MSRYFVQITAEELKDKIFKALIDGHKDEIIAYNDNKPVNTWDDLIVDHGSYKLFNYRALELMVELTPTVQKDLSKVKFDTENVEQDDKPQGAYQEGITYAKFPPMGFNTLPNGLALYGIYAGGDWEAPVYFIIYWDGKKLRGYIPTDGNPWNRTTKEAYGNDEEDDAADCKKHFPDHDGDDYSTLDFDADKIVADITARIVKKSNL